MKAEITTTPELVGSMGQQQMVIMNVSATTVWVSRDAATATAEEGLPLEEGAVLSTDGPLYASTESGTAELRILLPG